jgi:hypothetical protein
LEPWLAQLPSSCSLVSTTDIFFLFGWFGFWSSAVSHWESSSMFRFCFALLAKAPQECLLYLEHRSYCLCEANIYKHLLYHAYVCIPMSTLTFILYYLHNSKLEKRSLRNTSSNLAKLIQPSGDISLEKFFKN